MKTQKEIEFKKNFSLFEKSYKEGETIFDIVKNLEKYNLRGNKIVEEFLQELVDDWNEQHLQEISDLLREHLESEKIITKTNLKKKNEKK